MMTTGELVAACGELLFDANSKQLRACMRAMLDELDRREKARLDSEAEESAAAERVAPARLAARAAVLNDLCYAMRQLREYRVVSIGQALAALERVEVALASLENENV